VFLGLCAEPCGVERLCYAWGILVYSVRRRIVMPMGGCWLPTQRCASPTLFLLLMSSVIDYIYSIRAGMNVNVLSIGTAHINDTTEVSVSHAWRTCFEHWASIGELCAAFPQYYCSPFFYRNHVRCRLRGNQPNLSRQFAAERTYKYI
jgi:hypothetical protein